MIGIIIGLLIGITILLIELILKDKGGTIIERVERKVKGFKKGMVIMPRDSITESFAKKIKKNDQENKDTQLRDL